MSLEYVLQKEGILFQYDTTFTAISYLSRTITIEKWVIQYRKIKDEILLNTLGIITQNDGINIATKERAFLDLLYLNGDTYFDNLNILDNNKIQALLPIYQSATLIKRVQKLFKK